MHQRRACTPAAGQRRLHLAPGPSSIALVGVQHSPLAWPTTGSPGLVRDAWHRPWASLERRGLQAADFELARATPPSDEDLCR